MYGQWQTCSKLNSVCAPFYKNFFLLPYLAEMGILVRKTSTCFTMRLMASTCSPSFPPTYGARTVEYLQMETAWNVQKCMYIHYGQASYVRPSQGPMCNVPL